MTLIRDVLRLPSQVRKGEFVLAEGICKADDTVASYAITPSLVQAFDTNEPAKLVGLEGRALADDLGVL